MWSGRTGARPAASSSCSRPLAAHRRSSPRIRWMSFLGSIGRGQPDCLLLICGTLAGRSERPPGSRSWTERAGLLATGRWRHRDRSILPRGHRTAAYWPSRARGGSMSWTRPPACPATLRLQARRISTQRGLPTVGRSRSVPTGTPDSGPRPTSAVWISMSSASMAIEIWSEVVYGEDEAGGVSLVDLNTTNPERMDTPCTRIRESRSDIQR